eukprot:scaffold153842_cov28-Tisochrysis_lutea.AAC.1
MKRRQKKRREAGQRGGGKTWQCERKDSVGWREHVRDGLLRSGRGERRNAALQWRKSSWGRREGTSMEDSTRVERGSDENEAHSLRPASSCDEAPAVVARRWQTGVERCTLFLALTSAPACSSNSIAFLLVA